MPTPIAVEAERGRTTPEKGGLLLRASEIKPLFLSSVFVRSDSSFSNFFVFDRNVPYGIQIVRDAGGQK
jgi:hypothetical protein